MPLWPVRPVQHQPPLRWWNHAWRLGLCLLVSGVALTPVAAPADPATVPGYKVALDLVLGLLAYVLVCFRRRWPLPIVVLVTLLSCFSGVAAGPGLLAAVSIATRRRWPEILLVGTLGVACALFYTWWMPLPDDLVWWANAIVATLLTGAVVGWGLYIGSRRELVWTLHDRATRAEDEQELRAEKARGDERARIAREMHDVVAHRISQVSMYAGALTYRQDLSAEQMRESAALIQQQANAALTDLRSVLGVLRDPGSGELLNRPQPSHTQIPALVREAVEAGMNIELDLDTDALVTLPDAAGRTLFRAVQEGLTNAHKHAPGSVVRVRVAPSELDGSLGAVVEVRNPIGFGPRAAVPSSGLGLVGLRERFERADGTMSAHRVGAEFVLTGWLPWSA